MKGFNIYINNDKISVGVNAGLVMITIDAGSISVSGIDNEVFQSNKWNRTGLNLKDKIKVIASEIEDSMPYDAELIDRKELLVKYMKLKKELTERGLLK